MYLRSIHIVQIISLTLWLGPLLQSIVAVRRHLTQIALNLNNKTVQVNNSDEILFQQNKIIFERFTCSPSPPESKVQSLYCNVKRISRNNLKLHIHANITKPVNDVLFHVTFYYKFNRIVFNKYPIDLWENVCDYLDGKIMKSYMLDWIVKGLLKYTNLNHSCPYIGYVFLKADNISVDTLSFAPSLIPAGSYRIDIIGTESDRVTFAAAQMYFSVSEHRMEVV